MVDRDRVAFYIGRRYVGDIDRRIAAAILVDPDRVAVLRRKSAGRRQTDVA